MLLKVTRKNKPYVQTLGTNKKQDFQKGIEIIQDFCELNEIKVPEINIRSIKSPARYYESSKKININLNKCLLSKNGRKGMHFTGTVNETTVIGAMCHELGHYIHDTFFNDYADYEMRKANDQEIAVNAYASSNVYEDFAESIRLFILNPDLLRKGRPLRYKILKKCGLKPLHRLKYWEILIHGDTDVKYETAKWTLN